MTGKKYCERNLNQGKASWIFKILFVIFSAAVVYPGCSKQVSVEDNNIININFVYVADNDFPSIQQDQIRGWLEKSKYFYKQALGIDLEFKGDGVIRMNNFFDKYFDPSKKEPEIELFRILPDVREFNRYDKGILSIMKREDLQTLNRVISPYTNKQAQTYKELFSLVEHQYSASLEKAKSMNLLSANSYKYRSRANWAYILKNVEEYSLIITNGPIIEDFVNPSVFYLHAAGAFSFGFSEMGRSAVITFFPYISVKEISGNDFNELMPVVISHELGHAVFSLSHNLKETTSLMHPYSSSKQLPLKMQSFRLTQEEKSQSLAALKLRKGHKYFEGGLLEKAVEAYKQALTEAPNLQYPYYALATAYLRQKKYADAEQILDKAIEIQPEWSASYELLGDLYTSSSYEPNPRKNWLDESIRAYEKAIELNPFLINARQKLAYSYQSIGNTDKAIQEYQTVLQLDSTNVDVLRQLGLIYSHRGDCRNMYAVYDRLLKIEPNFAEAYYRLGLCQRRINPGKAVEYFRKYLDLEPDGEYVEIVKGYISNRES